MAKTWEEILQIQDIQEFKAETKKMLEEKGMTYGQFAATDEWQAAYRKAAEYRLTSPEPFMPRNPKQDNKCN